MKKVNNISWGLFNYNKRRFWKNLRDIPLVFKRVAFTLRHGYTPQAQWETFSWFTNVMKEIIHNYRCNREGTAIVIENYWDNKNRDEENAAVYNALLDEMLDLLDRMDEKSSIYDDMDWAEKDKAMVAAKDRFFELFSKYFYAFWD